MYKILIINNGLACGGIERASISLANYFAEKDFKVIVMALYQSEHFFKINKKIQFIEPQFSRTQFNQYLYVLKIINYVRKNIKKIKPSTILAFGEWNNPYVLFANIGLSYPIYISDRMNPLAKLPFVTNFLKKRLYKKASGIIAQSNFAKKILLERTNSRNIQVINNPVNVIEKIPCVKKKHIISIGRLSEEKGHQFLIEAFAMLNLNDWKLIIIGDGKDKEYLKSLTIKLKVKDNVLFLGHLKDFRLQLSQAQIFVLPSLKEGFPNALLEAMSLPLACISTDFFQGNHEIIVNEVNGLIVEPRNSFKLAESINKLVIDKTLRQKLAKAAYKVRNKYKFEKIGDEYLDFILNK